MNWRRCAGSAVTVARWCGSPWRLVVAVPIALNLVLLAPQLRVVENLNDSTFHVAMIRWAGRQISEGKIPLDGWFPNFSLGASQFHHYQSLPHILTAFVSGPLGAESTYLLSVYLLMSFWPLSVYWGARLLGRSRAEASIAALLSPLLVSASSYGFEPGSYVWQGYGLWSQLWGMVLLPPALGLTWRAIENRGRVVVPAAVIAFTIACAFIVGYMALAGAGAMAIVARARWRPRLLRAGLIAGCAVLIASWVLVPLISDQAYTSGVGFIGKSFYDSFGAGQVLDWLIHGQLLDSGHLPVISLLMGVGAAIAVRQWRRDISSRGVLCLALVGLILFIGPATIPLLRLLPGGSDLQFSRFIGMFQLAGLLLAGIGGGWIVFRLRALLTVGLVRLQSIRQIPVPLARSAVPVALTVIGALAVLSPTLALIHYESNGADIVAWQASSDASTGAALQPLLTQVTQLDHGRVYAGATFNWGTRNVVGYVPVFEELGNRDIDQVGFTGRVQSLSEDPEFFFDENNVADYRAFAVRYLILPVSSQPPVAATQLAVSGGNSLWELADVQPGYVRVVDTVAPALTADNKNLDSVAKAVMQSTDFQQGYYHPIAFAGQPAAPPSLPLGIATGSPGGVSDEKDNLDNGQVHATVTASRPAVALLSASYDNRWTAAVDGVDKPVQMIGPTLTGVAVPAGTHTVEFRYAPYPWYWFWFLVAAITVAAGVRPGTALATWGKLREGLRRLAPAGWFRTGVIK